MLVKGLILFSLLLGITNGEPCTCFIYLISEDGLATENKVAAVETKLENVMCDGDGLMLCKTTCERMFTEMSSNGKLCKKIPTRDERFADWLCLRLNRDVSNARLGVFAENCQEEPIDTGFRFTENLFCKSGHALYC